MRRWVAVALIIAVVMAAAPRKAAAVDDLVYIIPAALSGAIIVAVVIAIMVSDHSKEPELDLARIQPREAEAGVHFGQACRRPSGEMALLCW